MNRKKLELNQETLKNLTSSQAGTQEENFAYTFPPVCENTNYISCIRC